VTGGPLTVTTDAAGVYIISGIAPGTYNVTASAANFSSNRTLVTVVAGVTTTQNFALATLVGVLGDASGDGKTDITDALFLAQVTVNLRAFTPAQAAQADVNHDTKVDITDALFIAQATVNLRVLV